MSVIQRALAFTVCLLLTSSLAFESDELLIDDEEFGLEGGLTRTQSPSPTATTTSRKRFSESGSDSKIQFDLEHAFGDSQFSGAGNFSARLKTWNHGGQALTKLRFSRNSFNKIEQKNFENLLQEDDFYRIRLPSNVLSPPGRDYIISSVKAVSMNQVLVYWNFLNHLPDWVAFQLGVVFPFANFSFQVLQPHYALNLNFVILFVCPLLASYFVP